jgi:hypothetical protein
MDDVDREIESLVAVDPSPEFLARVRTRVAEEPGQSAVRWSWTLGLTAVTVALIATFVWQSDQDAPSSAVEVKLPQVAATMSPPAPVVIQIERPRASRRAGRTQEQETANLTPVISADDVRAFDMLLSAIDGGRFVLNDEMPISALSASTLAIAPITIEPVPVPEPLDGGVE